MKGQLIDLSHTIVHGQITYKGLPAPLVCDFLSRQQSEVHYEKGTSFHIGKIEMVANTGTYLDCPFHRFEAGKDVSQVALAQLANLPGILITVPFQESLTISKEYFVGKDLKGKAVLVCTGWSEHWQTDRYFEQHPYLTEDAAVYLSEQGVKLVGIDSVNIDNTELKTRPVHTELLGKEILIVEHLTNLKQLSDKAFSFSAVPPKIDGLGTFPVRAFACLI